MDEWALSQLTEDLVGSGGEDNRSAEQPGVTVLQRANDFETILRGRREIENDDVVVPLTGEVESSVAVGALALDGLVTHSRNSIIMTDPAGLKERTCECYVVTPKRCSRCSSGWLSQSVGEAIRAADTQERPE